MDRVITGNVSHENSIKDWLREAMETRPLIYQRLPDSKAAGNLISPSPADFYYYETGILTYIEAKFSAVAESLTSIAAKAISPNQRGSAILANRAGARYLFMFYSKASDTHEVWDSRYLIECNWSGKNMSRCQTIITTDNFDKAMETILYATQNRLR